MYTLCRKGLRWYVFEGLTLSGKNTFVNCLQFSVIALDDTVNKVVSAGETQCLLKGQNTGYQKINMGT